MADREHRVLFVDDEPNILRALRRLCRREPFEVLTAASGQEGLDALRETPACVVIADYRMPGMTGVEMLAAAKDIVPDSIRIILSGFADTEAVLEAINKGEVYRFLSKPWNDSELLTTIRQSLEHWELKRQNADLEAQLVEQNKRLIRLNENLEELVAERTHSLSFAQEVLENLPVGVIGVSGDGEVMLTNSCVARMWPDLGMWPPGTEMDDALPHEICSRVRAAVDSDMDGEYLRCPLGADEVHLTVSRLDASDPERGCILVLRPPAEVPA